MTRFPNTAIATAAATTAPDGSSSQTEPDPGRRPALQAGIGHEREYVRFGSGLLDAG